MGGVVREDVVGLREEGRTVSETMGDILHRLVREPAKDDRILSFITKLCDIGVHTSMPYIKIPTWIKQWWRLNPLQAGVAKLSFSSSEFGCQLGASYHVQGS